jgi:hypothetical protein
MAYSAALVYHVRSYLHVSLDYLRANARWFGAPAVLAMGFPAEKQNVNFVSAGVTATW